MKYKPIQTITFCQIVTIIHFKIEGIYHSCGNIFHVVFIYGILLTYTHALLCTLWNVIFALQFIIHSTQVRFLRFKHIIQLQQIQTKSVAIV